jgi:hypothetical protein
VSFFFISLPISASAHTGDFIEGVTVKSGGSNIGVNETLNSTPRVIVFDVNGDVNASISVKNIEGDSVVSRSPVRISGKYIVFEPPLLDAGTYIIQVKQPFFLGDKVKEQVFVMKQSSGVYSGFSEFTNNNYKLYAYILGSFLVIAGGFLLRVNTVKVNEFLMKGSPKFLLKFFETSIVSTESVPASQLGLSEYTNNDSSSKKNLLGFITSIFLVFFGFCVIIVANFEYGLLLSIILSLVVTLLGFIAGFTLSNGFNLVTGTAFAVSVIISITILLVLFPVNIFVIGFIVFNLIIVAAGVVFSKNFSGFTSIFVLVSFVSIVGVLYANPSKAFELGGFTKGKVANVAECLNLDIFPRKEACIEEYYADITKTEGTVAGLQALDGDKFSVPGLLSFCHSGSHAIGRESYRVEGSVAKAFETGFDVCDFGFFHGVIEGSSSNLDDSGFKELIATVCTDLADSSELFYTQCAHGVGHAAARRSNNDLVKGFNFCESFDKARVSERFKETALTACGTGVSMEWFAGAGAPGAVLANFLPEVSFLPDACLDVPGRWQADCFEYVGNTVDSSRPVESLAQLAELCSNSPQESACFKGLARAAAGLKIGDEQAIDLCLLTSDPASIDSCLFMYIFTTSATVEYDLGAVDRICNKIKTRGVSYVNVCDLAFNVSKESLEFSR